MSPSPRLAIVYKTAEGMEPSRPSSRFSFMKVEKVVNPPQNPVTRTSFVEGEIWFPIDAPDSSPIRKQPKTLTVIVPQGYPLPTNDWNSFATRYRLPPPKKLPMQTNKRSFISFLFLSTAKVHIIVEITKHLSFTLDSFNGANIRK